MCILFFLIYRKTNSKKNQSTEIFQVFVNIVICLLCIVQLVSFVHSSHYKRKEIKILTEMLDLIFFRYIYISVLYTRNKLYFLYILYISLYTYIILF